jgi:hypothetical protein
MIIQDQPIKPSTIQNLAELELKNRYEMNINALYDGDNSSQNLSELKSAVHSILNCFNIKNNEQKDETKLQRTETKTARPIDWEYKQKLKNFVNEIMKPSSHIMFNREKSFKDCHHIEYFNSLILFDDSDEVRLTS